VTDLPFAAAFAANDAGSKEDASLVGRDDAEVGLLEELAETAPTQATIW
jgi:hypothetical protein